MLSRLRNERTVVFARKSSHWDAGRVVLERVGNDDVTTARQLGLVRPHIVHLSASKQYNSDKEIKYNALAAYSLIWDEFSLDDSY